MVRIAKVSHHRCGEEMRQESIEEYMKTLDAMNQTNERIDKRTDNLEARQSPRMETRPDLRTEHITENEGGRDYCGHCFASVCLRSRLPLWEESPCLPA